MEPRNVTTTREPIFFLSFLDGNSETFDATKFNEVTKESPFIIETFYRSDNRTISELAPNGFAPRRQADNENIVNFIKACCTISEQEARDFAFMNQYRSTSEYSNYGDYFVSTAIDCGHKGGNEYKIDGLKMFFYKVVDKVRGSFCVGISQNDWGKPIRAIKLNDKEVVFLDAIPMEYIKEK